MRLSPPKGLWAITLTTSALFNSVTSQTFLRCNINQQLTLWNAWDDAIMLASAAWSVLNGRTNEALVRKYFFAISIEDRAMAESAFLNAANSGTVRNSYVLACGDFLAGDVSSTGVPVPAPMTGCQDPLTNAYTRKVSYMGDVIGQATNDIAACAMLNPNRIGTLQGIMTDLNRFIAFCAETDIPGLTGANIGMSRRTYFPGWTLLHELMHTTSVAGHLLAQGPTDNMPYWGAADFTYDQADAGLLEPDQAARNADSYAHFAWEAFYTQTCAGQAKSAPKKFSPDDYVDWDAMEAALTKRTPGPPPNAALEDFVAATDNDDKLETTPAIVERRTSHPLAKRQGGTKPKTRTGPTKPRTRKRKGASRKVKIIQCKGCRQVLKGQAKPGKKLAPPTRVAIKKCKAKEIFIPAVLASKRPNPKLKKGVCMPVPSKVATTPGTKKPTTPGKKTPVKLPVVKQPGKSKVVMPKKKAPVRKVN